MTNNINFSEIYNEYEKNGKKKKINEKVNKITYLLILNSD